MTARQVWEVNGADGWAMFSQTAMKHKALHQKAWLLEMHNAFIGSALQRAEAQVIKESLCTSFDTVLGLVAFMLDAPVPTNNHTPHCWVGNPIYSHP